MAKYRRKPEIVDAVQWFQHGDHPAVKAGPSGYGLLVLRGGCLVSVKPGDWIIRVGIYDIFTMDNECFRKYYEPVED